MNETRNFKTKVGKCSQLTTHYCDFYRPGNQSVMLTIGNTLANSVWECQVHSRTKPTPASSREEKVRRRAVQCLKTSL